MEEKRNNRKVEHRLTDALRFDRARIQVGRISHFGLMEMSRQRMRTGVLEGSTSQCPHCQGTGMIRSTESVALAVLRGLEDHLVKDPRSSVNVLTTATVALYILNNKRSFIIDIERRYGVVVAVQASDRMQGANFAIERSAAPVVAPRPADRAAVSMDWGFDGEDAHAQDTQTGHDHASAHDHRGGHTHTHEQSVEIVDGDPDGGDEGGDSEARNDSGDGNRTGRRRRRRRGRDRGDRGPSGGQTQPHAGRGDQDGEHNQQTDLAPLDDAPRADDAGESVQTNGGDGAATASGEPNASGEDGDRGARRGRRRGRRGGRRGREQRDENGVVTAADGDAGQNDADADAGGDDAGDTAPADGYVDDHSSAAHSAAAHDVSADHAPATPHVSAALEAAHSSHDDAALTAPAHVETAHAAPARVESAHAAPAHAVSAHAEVGSQPAPVEAADAALIDAPRKREPRRERSVEPALTLVGKVPEAKPVAAVDPMPNGAHADAATMTHPVEITAPTVVKTEAVPTMQLPEAPDDPSRPRRRGWWQRRGLGE